MFAFQIWNDHFREWDHFVEPTETVIFIKTRMKLIVTIEIFEIFVINFGVLDIF